jgi:hypothetical protein
MRHQHRIHTLVSHVRGPGEPVSIAGATVESIIPVAVGEAGNTTRLLHRPVVRRNPHPHRHRRRRPRPRPRPTRPDRRATGRIRGHHGDSAPVMMRRRPPHAATRVPVRRSRLDR